MMLIILLLIIYENFNPTDKGTNEAYRVIWANSDGTGDAELAQPYCEEYYTNCGASANTCGGGSVECTETGITDPSCGTCTSPTSTSYRQWKLFNLQ